MRKSMLTGKEIERLSRSVAWLHALISELTKAEESIDGCISMMSVISDLINMPEVLRDGLTHRIQNSIAVKYSISQLLDGIEKKIGELK